VQGLPLLRRTFAQFRRGSGLMGPKATRSEAHGLRGHGIRRGCGRGRVLPGLNRIGAHGSMKLEKRTARRGRWLLVWAMSPMAYGYARTGLDVQMIVRCRPVTTPIAAAVRKCPRPDGAMVFARNPRIFSGERVQVLQPTR